MVLRGNINLNIIKQEMKIVITGPKCSGKSRIGRLLSQSVSLPFFETDELIEQLFKKEKGKTLSCRAICSEYGEVFFRDYERRVIKQISEYDFCIISTGGSTLLNKESRELLRGNSILVLLYASSSVLLERFYKKDMPSFLKDKNSRDLFAIRANLVIEVLKPFADITVDSSGIDINKTLSVLINNFRNKLKLYFMDYINNKNSALLFIGQISSSNFLFSLNKKLIEKPEIDKKLFTCSGLSGISVKKEELSAFNKSQVNLFSLKMNKELIELIVNILKKYFIMSVRKKEDFLSPVLTGVLARNILKESGIKISAYFPAKGKGEIESIRSLSIEINDGATYKKRQKEFFSAVSMFFLFCVDIKFDFAEVKQQIPDAEHVISFRLANPLPEEEKILAEVITLYCALIIFNILF